MKRLIVTIILYLFPITSYGQLNKIDLSDYRQDVVVHNFGHNIGYIHYTQEGYVLFGITNDIFEVLMPSIFLGETKEDAIASLNELDNIDTKHNQLLRGEFYYASIIYSYDGSKKNLMLITEGVRGQSPILSILTHEMYNSAIKSIVKFNEKW